MNSIHKKLPNMLTITRIALIPVFIMSFHLEDKWWSSFIAAILLSIAGITDFFDGYLARALSAESSFGKALDPLADKLVVVSAIVMLIYTQKISGWEILPSVTIVVREVLITILRKLSHKKKQDYINSNTISKWKTFIQMISLITLTLNFPVTFFNLPELHIMHQIAKILLWMSVFLSIVSGVQYFRQYTVKKPSKMIQCNN